MNTFFNVFGNGFGLASSKLLEEIVRDQRRVTYHCRYPSTIRMRHQIYTLNLCI